MLRAETRINMRIWDQKTFLCWVRAQRFKKSQSWHGEEWAVRPLSRESTRVGPIWGCIWGEPRWTSWEVNAKSRAKVGRWGHLGGRSGREDRGWWRLEDGGPPAPEIWEARFLRPALQMPSELPGPSHSSHLLKSSPSSPSVWRETRELKVQALLPDCLREKAAQPPTGLEPWVDDQAPLSRWSHLIDGNAAARTYLRHAGGAVWTSTLCSPHQGPGIESVVDFSCCVNFLGQM